MGVSSAYLNCDEGNPGNKFFNKLLDSARISSSWFLYVVCLPLVSRVKSTYEPHCPLHLHTQLKLQSAQVPSNPKTNAARLVYHHFVAEAIKRRHKHTVHSHIAPFKTESLTTKLYIFDKLFKLSYNDSLNHTLILFHQNFNLHKGRSLFPA